MQVEHVTEGAQRVYSLKFDEDEEVVAALTAFAQQERVTDATVAGIGAFKQVSLARYNPATRQLDAIALDDDQVEVLSFIGQVTLRDGAANVHVHVVLGRHDGTTRGGHLVKGVVRPLLLLTITESAFPLSPLHPR